MHSLSPRTLEGDEWWNITRRAVYGKYNYHCIACGISKEEAKGPKWLEAHEFWDIDYNKGICKIKSIEPLCHYCHNFIHSGRLNMIMGKSKTPEEARDILEHGFKILAKNKLKCFPGTLHFAQSLGCNTFGVKAYKLPDIDIPWNKWYLLWKGKKYYSNFKDYADWENFYSGY
jgi:hypothetical protein